MKDASIVTTTDTGQIVAQQASSDDQLVAMWLHEKGQLTQALYLKEYQRLAAFMARRGISTLKDLKLGDLYAYADDFPSQWSDRTKNLRKAAIKSLLTFAHKLGYVHFNVGTLLKTEVPSGVLAERILSEDQMNEAIAAAPPQAHLFLAFLYASALRLSEALDLRWRDVNWVGGRPVLTVLHGKGKKRRQVNCSPVVWAAVEATRPGNASPDDLIFPFSRASAYRWTKVAFEKIGVPEASPHWARHAFVIQVSTHAEGGAVNWHAIARQLGHTDPAFTMRQYGHFTGQDISALIDVRL
jgi:integrase